MQICSVYLRGRCAYVGQQRRQRHQWQQQRRWHHTSALCASIVPALHTLYTHVFCPWFLCAGSTCIAGRGGGSVVPAQPHPRSNPPGHQAREHTAGPGQVAGSKRRWRRSKRRRKKRSRRRSRRRSMRRRQQRRWGSVDGAACRLWAACGERDSCAKERKTERIMPLGMS